MDNSDFVMIKQGLIFCALVSVFAPVAWQRGAAPDVPTAGDGRTAILSLPYAITASGSFYLTGRPRASCAPCLS